MALVPTRLDREQLLSPVRTKAGGDGAPARDDIMGWMQSTIPAGMGAHRDARPGQDVDTLLHAAFDAMEEAAAICGVPLSTSQSANPGRDAFVERGRSGPTATCG